MSTLYKNLLMVIEDAMFNPSVKQKVEGQKEQGKNYYVAMEINSLTGESEYWLYVGNTKKTMCDGSTYIALIAEIFACYIKF